MPHFDLLTNPDGSVRQLLKDGEPYDEPLRFEQLYSIVATYFKLAGSNLHSMQATDDQARLRDHGLQAFLMSLTGIEAFTNVFFTLAAEQSDNEVLRSRVNKFGPLVERLRNCIDLAFGQKLEGQDVLLAEIKKLYSLRNRIVHPRWDPASVTIGGALPISFSGMALNFQAAFEDVALCQEAFDWCLLLVIRVARAAGNDPVDGFCFHWTGQYGLTEEAVLQRLGLGVYD